MKFHSFCVFCSLHCLILATTQSILGNSSLKLLCCEMVVTHNRKSFVLKYAQLYSQLRVWAESETIFHFKKNNGNLGTGGQQVEWTRDKKMSESRQEKMQKDRKVLNVRALMINILILALYLQLYCVSNSINPYCLIWASLKNYID